MKLYNILKQGKQKNIFSNEKLLIKLIPPPYQREFYGDFGKK